MDWDEDFDWEDYHQLPSEQTVSRYIMAMKTAGSSEDPLVFVVYTWDEECVFRYGEVLSAIYL